MIVLDCYLITVIRTLPLLLKIIVTTTATVTITTAIATTVM